MADASPIPMTDTFANGPSASGGAAPDTPPQAGDVTGTLAELERKLRELESELSSIGRRREVVGAIPPDSSSAASPSSAEGRLVDEAIEPPTQVAPVTSIVPPAQVAPPAPMAPSAARASAPIRPAPEEPAGAGQPVKFMRPQRPRPSETQLASLAELRRFRDRLERFARELAAEYDALLGRVMSGLTAPSIPPDPPTSAQLATEPTASTQPAAGPIPSTQRATEPLTSTQPAAGPIPSTQRATEPLTSTQPAAEPPTSLQPTGEPLPVATPGSPEDVLFEGRVELGVGPFYDIASLSAFERGLASLPYVVEASVRRFEASHAVVDVRLAAPVALVRELRRTVESDFNVREVADGRVLLTFDEG